MKSTILNFYREFYGPIFVRHFRAPTDLKTHKKRNPGNQTIIENPKKLWLQVHKRSGLWPCYIHVYDHGLLGNLKRQSQVQMVYDRAFFDFDIDNEQSHKIKKELQKLRSNGLKHNQPQQDDLKEQLRNLIINEHIAEPAITEAKKFSTKFKESFGAYPLLFFSGCKGCHAYTFFEPIKNVDINSAIYWFGKTIKKDLKYNSLDLSVLKDAQVRLSRVPYSKHQYTLLNVIPFTIKDSYDTIIQKSINPIVEPFQKKKYYSSFGLHLKNIDPILKNNEKTRKKEEMAKSKYKKVSKSFSGVNDHRTFFQDLLGPPISEHSEKEYVMYHCPFPDHEDTKPSFKVHRTNYECYGCGKKGNLAIKKDFLKFKKIMETIKKE